MHGWGGGGNPPPPRSKPAVRAWVSPPPRFSRCPLSLPLRGAQRRVFGDGSAAQFCCGKAEEAAAKLTRVRSPARNDKELVGCERVKVVETQQPTSQWLESSAWRPGPASGRDVSVRSQGITSRAGRDTVMLSRHEPPDRSFNEG